MGLVVDSRPNSLFRQPLPAKTSGFSCREGEPGWLREATRATGQADKQFLLFALKINSIWRVNSFTSGFVIAC